MPTDSPDSIVLSKAQQLDAVLVSLNGDFADIVTYPPEFGVKAFLIIVEQKQSALISG